MKFHSEHRLCVPDETDFDESIARMLQRTDECRTEGYFSGFDGEKLYYEYFLAEASRGAVVILHGLSEFTRKYHEFAYYLLDNGLDVFLYDQRSHGHSCRLTSHKDLIHVDRFSDYEKDLQCFLDQIVRPNTQGPLYLFSHSMGGAVAAFYLAHNAGVFQKAILSAPMVEPLTGNVNPGFARAGLSAWLLFHDRKEKFWYTNEFDPDYPFARSQDQSLARFQHNMRLRLSDENYRTTPLSMGWVHQSLSVKKKLTCRRFLKNIQTPVLMLCAEHDRVVSEKAQAVFAQRCDACHRMVLPGTTHALLSGTKESILNFVRLVLDHFSA